MKDYSYLGWVNPPRYWKQFVMSWKLFEYDGHGWLDNKHSFWLDEVITDQYDYECPLNIVASKTVSWHRDHLNFKYSTMCVLRSDQHLIQDNHPLNKDNQRVLKAGDIVRLNISNVHRLISKSKDPIPFVAVCYDSNEKVTPLAAATYFKYLFKQQR